VTQDSSDSRMKNKVLFIDDEENLLTMAKRVFANVWDVRTAINKDEAFEQLFNEEIVVVISDYKMPIVDGVTLLSEIKVLKPEIRRILLSGNLNLDTTIDAVNLANIHGVMQKPWKRDELIKKVNKEIEIYNENKKQKEEVKQLHEISQKSVAKPSDDLLDLMINLSEISSGTDFTDKFINTTSGLISLCEINWELYKDNSSDYSFRYIFQILLDAEVIANQYEQKVLIMYINLLRSYLHLVDKNIEEAFNNYKGSLFIYQWLAEHYIDDQVIEYIRKFPNIEEFSEYEVVKRYNNPKNSYRDQTEEEIQLEINEIFTRIDLEIIKSCVDELLKFDVSSMITFNQSLLNYLQSESAKLQHLIVIKDQLPIFDKKFYKSDSDANLISGFISAISNFLEELVNEQGDIETIKHKNGIIMFQTIGEYKYILLSSKDDIRLRIGLKQFAYKSFDILKEVPKNYYVNDDQMEELLNISEKTLGIR
jgi:FixJ family two-component response regulator